MAFDNSTIKPKRDNKPHIVYINGYWRVSSLKKSNMYFTTRKKFEIAHKFIIDLNEKLFLLEFKRLNANVKSLLQQPIKAELNRKD